MARQPLLGDGWELVGRQRQLRAIEWAAARAGGGGIVLCGPPGVGKTRLARDALTRLAPGQPTEWVAATRAASAIPFGALSHLLPEDGPRGDRLAVLRGVAERFSSGRPVVAVDDAHLLDDASAAVLHHLALRSPAFLLVTVRSGEPCPDAVTALWKESLATRVELPALPDDAVDALLRQAFGDRMDVVSRRRLARVSAGNPLLLRETLRAGLDTGSLRYRRGEWSWAGDVRPTTRLVEVVAARLGTVDDAVLRVLELVACGEPLAAGILESLCDTEAVAEAERLGLVVVERDGSRSAARLSHPLYGEVLRETMAQTRARAIFAQLAAAFAATPMRRRDDALRAGVWQLRAGRLGDPDTLLDASRQALRRLDNTLAEKLARAACDAGGGVAAENVLAQVLSHCGWYEESVRALPAVDTDPAGERTRWATVRSDILYWGEGRVTEAERVLDEVGSAPGRRAADANRSLILMFDSRCAESLRVGSAVLDGGDAEPQAVVWAACGAGASAGVLGDLDRAEAIYQHGLAVAAEHLDELPWGRVQVCTGYLMGLLAAGRVREAQALAEREYELAQTGAPELRGTWAGFRGVTAKARGDLLGAGEALHRSLTLLARYNTFRLAAPCLAELAGAGALRGDAARADRLMARADSPERRPSRLFVPWMRLDRAWTLVACGDVTTAAATARQAATLARYSGQPTVEAWALYDAARLGDAGAVHARLTELARSTPAVGAFARAATALARSDAERLDRAAADFVSQGLVLHAAEIETRAADLHRAAGRHTKATRSTAQADELTRHCPSARTPLLATAAPGDGLTRREQEIVSLAATGRTSKGIAAHLGLSVRTIDNHLSRAYAKLGVRGRAELPGTLREVGALPRARHR